MTEISLSSSRRASNQFRPQVEVLEQRIMLDAAGPQALAPGLLGMYFNDTKADPTRAGENYHLSSLNQPGGKAVERVDPLINWLWKNQNATIPNPQVAVPTQTKAGTTLPKDIGGDKRNNFSVIWVGYIVAPKTGHYTFTANADDGERVILNNQVIIDDFGGHGPRNANSKPEVLKAGQKYAFMMEYWEDADGGAQASLSWQAADAGIKNPEVVPASAFFHTEIGRVTDTAATFGAYVRQEIKLLEDGLLPQKTFDAIKADFQNRFGANFLQKADLEKKFLANVRPGAFADAIRYDTIDFNQFAAHLKAADVPNQFGDIIQQVTIEETKTPTKPGEKPVTTKSSFVEGFAIDPNGRAKTLDLHALRDGTFFTTSTKSVKVVFTFQVGQGLYDGKPLTGIGGPFDLKGQFQIFGTDTNRITWLGPPRKFEMVFTIDANGKWSFHDSAAKIDRSGALRK